MADGLGLGDVVLTNVNRLKLKRPQTAKKYRSVLDELYEEVEKGSGPKAKL